MCSACKDNTRITSPSRRLPCAIPTGWSLAPFGIILPTFILWKQNYSLQRKISIDMSWSYRRVYQAQVPGSQRPAGDRVAQSILYLPRVMLIVLLARACEPLCLYGDILYRELY